MKPGDLLVGDGLEACGVGPLRAPVVRHRGLCAAPGPRQHHQPPATAVQALICTWFVSWSGLSAATFNCTPLSDSLAGRQCTLHH